MVKWIAFSSWLGDADVFLLKKRGNDVVAMQSVLNEVILVHSIKGAGGGYVMHWACLLNGWSDSPFQGQIEDLQQYTAALSQRFGDE